MLSTAAITAFLSTTSARQAKAFYGSTLGLRLLGEDDFALVFAAGGRRCGFRRSRPSRRSHSRLSGGR
jgi:catechol 2,3-dioxygenase-like lactoylglutathione lyase family enzyme